MPPNSQEIPVCARAHTHTHTQTHTLTQLLLPRLSRSIIPEIPARAHTHTHTSTLTHLLLPRLSRSIIPASSKLTHPPSPAPKVAYPNQRSHGWRWPCHLPRIQLDSTLECSLLATPNSISRDPRPTHGCPCQPPHPHLSPPFLVWLEQQPAPQPPHPAFSRAQEIVSKQRSYRA